MNGEGSGPDGRLIGLLLPVGIVFVALIASNAMDLGDGVSQHKRLQSNLTVARQQVVVGQAKNRRLADVGRGIIDLAPTNRYAAAIQTRFQIRPSSRGGSAMVDAAPGSATNRPAPGASAPAVAPAPDSTAAPSVAPPASPYFQMTNPPGWKAEGGQFSLEARPVGPTAAPPGPRPPGR